MSTLRRFEPVTVSPERDEYASMREHENGTWTDYFKALSIEAERDALKARVAELEAYLAGWVKISERNPPVPGVYKVMVTRPIHGGSFVSHIRWDGQLWESLWESLNVGPIDYQLVAWYDNGLEI